MNRPSAKPRERPDPDLKTVERKLPGFESQPLRQRSKREMAILVAETGLVLSEAGSDRGSNSRYQQGRWPGDSRPAEPASIPRRRPSPGRSYAETDLECMSLLMSDLRDWMLGLPAQGLHTFTAQEARTRQPAISAASTNAALARARGRGPLALQDIDCSSTNRVVLAHEREVRRRQTG